MEYIQLFNQLEGQISNKIGDLQKQEGKLLEKKKQLLNTKQKITGFLSDAYEMKQTLDFNPDLVESVHLELNKIFQGKKPLSIEPKSKTTDEIKGKATDSNSKPVSASASASASASLSKKKIVRTRRN